MPYSGAMLADPTRFRERAEIRSPAGIVSIWALVCAVALSSACDSRVREIRAQLPPEQQTLFDRGNKLSGPCWTCHDFTGTQNKIGPHLHGVYGRRAGGSDFGGYSAALRATGAVWDDRTLDAFLADPQRFAPGTTMISPGVPNPADRAALLFYMKQVTLKPATR